MVVSRYIKDGKGRDVKRMSNRGGRGGEGTKWMAGRPLATAGGRDHRCGHFRWRANSRRGIREGVRAWKGKWTGHKGKDGTWRGAGGRGGMEGPGR